MDSVIKVYCTSSSPNYLSPWQNKPIRSQTGSGFVIDGKRIITNAHVVADALQVMVRRPGSPVKYPARVVASGHECDLAVLHVDSEEFWEPYLKHPEQVTHISEAPETSEAQATTPELTLSNDATVVSSSTHPTKMYKGLEFCDWIPLLQDDVMVIGYPMGGDNACITQGVVSRVEPVLYAHAATHLLAVQIDAAINPGNSGGPAFVDGKVVGVAFQNIQNANNVGYIIPVPIIRHFLHDVDNGGYRVHSPGGSPDYNVAGEPISDTGRGQSKDLTPLNKMKSTVRRGFCSLGILCQGTSNATLQRFLGMVPPPVLGSNESQDATPHAISTNATSIASNTQATYATASAPDSSEPNASNAQGAAVQPSSANSLVEGTASSISTATTTQATELSSRFSFLRSPLPAAFAHAAPQAQAALFPQNTLATLEEAAMSASPNLGLTTTPATQSSVYHLGKEPITGILVNKVDIYSPCYGILQRNDVLIAVDGHPIACDGTVAFRGRERIAFDYLISLKYAGETARLTFLRRKSTKGAASPDNVELIEREVPMRPLDHLVSVFEYDRLPSYFVFAGVVCVPLTQPFLHEFGKDWYNTAPRDLVQLAVQGSPQFPGQEIVLLAQILPADCTFGYTNIQDLQVKFLNGIRVRNLAHFVRIVERAILRAAEQFEHDLDMKRAANPALYTGESMRRSEVTGVSECSPFREYLTTHRLSILPAEERARLNMRGWDADQQDPDDVDPIPNSDQTMAQSPLAEDPYTLVFELSDYRVVVLDLRAAAQQHPRILTTHRVPQDRSEGLGL